MSRRTRSAPLTLAVWFTYKIRILVRTRHAAPVPAQHRRDCHGKNLEVHLQRPVIDVMQIKRDPTIKAHVAATAHLPQAGKSRLDTESPHQP